MQFSSTIVALGALAASAMAAPSAELAERQITNYYLKVSAPGTAFDGLYLSSYHTGAGFADVTLAPTGDVFSNGQNGTIDSNIYGSGIGTGISLPAGSGTTYNDWYNVAIDAGSATPGFTVTSTSVTSSQSYFQGWLACDWAHDSVPQLFYLVEEYPRIPSNCAKVQLGFTQQD